MRIDFAYHLWVCLFWSKHSAAGHLRSINRLFREARQQAGLPKELVLYCAGHDYGTQVQPPTPAFSDLGQPEPTTTYRFAGDCQAPANTWKAEHHGLESWAGFGVE
jgi:hypothetical protein